MSKWTPNYVSWSPLIILSLIACAAILYLAVRAQATLDSLTVKSADCKPLRCLPNSWLMPFGLDKLRKVMRAERLRRYPLLMLEEHEKYGDTYAQWAASYYTVLTRDPRNIRAILSRQFNDFELGAGRGGCVAPLLGDGIFTQDGANWEQSRKLLAPLIQKPTLPSLDLIEKHFQQLLGRLLPSSGSAPDKQGSSVINLKEPLFAFSLAISTEFLLGEPHQPSTSKETNAAQSKSFADAFNTAFYWIARRERLKAFYWLVDGIEFRKSCSAARAIVEDIVKQQAHAIKDESCGTTTANHFALASMLHKEANLGKVRDQFLNLLLAGRDTSGSLFCWIFYSLSREPEQFRRLKKETLDFLGGDRDRKPTKTELGQMVGLDHFICETLRIFPPIPLNSRSCVRTTTLPHGGGEDGESTIVIPKGTLIAFSTFAAHRSKKLYGLDADKFRVSRWAERSSKQRVLDWAYHPFSAGPRKCLGEKFSLIAAKYVTCRFLQHFDGAIPTDESDQMISPAPEGSWVDDVRYEVGLTMSPYDGPWVRLVPAS